jgi:hypothetical protein
MPNQDLTTGIAVYGAVLGTIGTIVSLALVYIEIRKGRRALRITCTEIDIPPAILWGGDLERPHYTGIEVRVLNNGQRPIQIAKVGLGMSDGHLFTTSYSVELNKKLEFSDSYKVQFHISELQKEASKRVKVFTRAVVIDAEDKKYTARLPKSLKEKELI